MSEQRFGAELIRAMLDRCLDQRPFTEITDGDQPQLRFHPPGDPTADAGELRLWRASDPFDRMIRVSLRNAAVETQLFFLFARGDRPEPHFHAQVVQFGPDGCVYNVDLLPRLDPIDHPDYYRQVFQPITRAYWEATQGPGNACATVTTNPAIAAYLSPWSLGVSRPTDRAELERVRPQLFAYLDHCLALADSLDYEVPDTQRLRERDRRHLNCFFDERLDRRAWQGVYRIIGEEPGRRMRELLMTALN